MSMATSCLILSSITFIMLILIDNIDWFGEKCKFLTVHRVSQNVTDTNISLVLNTLCLRQAVD